MTKYLVCGLDSDHYTQPDFEFTDDYEKAKRITFDWCCNYDIDNVEGYDETEMRRVTDDNNGNFYVSQVFRVDYEENETHLVVWHHAYDGVDFEVRFKGSYDECCMYVEKDMEDTYNELPIDLKEYNSDYDMTIDTGEEWEHWEIVEIN